MRIEIFLGGGQEELSWRGSTPISSPRYGAAGKRMMAGLVAHGWGNASVPCSNDCDGRKGGTTPLLIRASLTLLAGVLAMICRLRWRTAGRLPEFRQHDKRAGSRDTATPRARV
jgi:hypothetical protein